MTGERERQAWIGNDAVSQVSVAPVADAVGAP
jgi:hypothetical protein